MMGYSYATKSRRLSSIMTGHFVTAEPKAASPTRCLCRTVTTLCHIGNAQAALGDVLDRFDFESIGVTLVAHGTLMGLILRLGGIYETRGDSRYSLQVARKCRRDS
jgi:hypothetical protein